ncbi:MAG: biopolymer transporter ExbD [Nitrospira sp.]
MPTREDRRITRRKNSGDLSLNITPFLNLMVVLVPVLLSGVVFSRVAILEMSLPSVPTKEVHAEMPKETFKLIVTIRRDELVVRGSGVGTRRLPGKKGTYNLKKLAVLLQKVKEKYPGEKSLILLSEPEIPYESLIAVMDTCREYQSDLLFPDISIGEVKPA